MKRYSSILALLTLTGIFAVAQNMPRQQQPQQPQEMPQTQQPSASDQEKTSTGNPTGVQSDIQVALQKEPTLASANINVQVTDKNVELSGTVPNKDAKEKAEQIAKTHAGSLSVKSHLKVAHGGSQP